VRQRKKNEGFSLIELMIVVAVAAILVAIAYPSYRDYVLRTNRSSAESAMYDIAQHLERCYTQFQTYANGSCPTGTMLTTQQNLASNFNLALTTQSNTQYTIQASAIGSQTDDTNCQVLTLNQAGVKSATDGGGNDTTATCWRD
jgi:type IV pilus assembly protein PilE